MQIEETNSDYDREKLQERLAKLVGGVAVIHVGAATEVEMKEKKARVEDALNATRAAAEMGIVPGGGVALIRSQESLDKRSTSTATSSSASTSSARPARLRCAASLATPAWMRRSSCTRCARAATTFGWNAADDTWGDMFELGIIDPTKVTVTALRNAASVAGLLLTTEAMIAEKKEDEYLDEA